MIKLFDLHFSIIFQVIIIASYLIHKKGTFIIKIIKTVHFYTYINNYLSYNNYNSVDITIIIFHILEHTVEYDQMNIQINLVSISILKINIV